ncbi:hypothetical protein [Amycolatopsis albispora]|uniref:Beta-lactamase n=1 Tax=Amycolatopsis albispora TaxID=1804986 RepID=A0A344L281_9PSEU|nr:hypothetical protein [Amycolatopsis albispora]AXB42155.1 hypothetical protein A4R43_06090 [Amycolatopsis albispora]
MGAGLDADFEIGSVSKGITGLLYADSLERGEVTPSTTLGELRTSWHPARCPDRRGLAHP